MEVPDSMKTGWFWGILVGLLIGGGLTGALTFVWYMLAGWPDVYPALAIAIWGAMTTTYISSKVADSPDPDKIANLEVELLDEL